MWKLVGALALVLHVVLGAIPEHEIESLPGYDGKLPSRQYSGYINVDSTTGKYLHYWFVESMNDPATDPVMVWLNGGPGCSSLGGFLLEMGPFNFLHNATFDEEIPTLVQNEYAWNNVANMLYIESPAGVGFSYSDTLGDFVTNDNITAADNLRFLELFFAGYPEYASNDFYVAGESYAGVYVPTLAQAIMIYNEAKSGPQINLKGFMVGNGCIGDDVGSCSTQGTQTSIDYLWAHGLYSSKLHDNIVAACPDPTRPSEKCSFYLQEMATAIDHVNVFDIYDTCINGDYLQQHTKVGFRKFLDENHPFQRLMANRLGGPDECIDARLPGKYLNNDAVRKAIHMPLLSDSSRWEVCTDSLNYTSNTKNLLPVYPTLLAKYRVLIFSGDTDACVPYTDSEAWTSGLGLAESEAWRAWRINEQVAGYVTTYAVNNFTFLTVKGAGHTVAQYKPKEGFAMVQRYLKGNGF